MSFPIEKVIEMVKVNIIFHSMWGHMHKMALAVAEGARSEGADVKVLQVPETLPDEVLSKMGAIETKKAFKDVPIATMNDLEEADALVFGAGTRFGIMTSQMRAFLDRTGGLWEKNALVGKPGGAFTGSQTQHGGQETTLVSFHATLLHQGMIVVGVPYSEKRQSISSEITGGSPYGASTVTGVMGSPSENELEIARFQGRHITKIAKKLAAKHK
jgi:NAD(P)H dehydrogenase (quinone)